MAELTVRLERRLWLFVAPRRRRPQQQVAHDDTASLGHVVQALGVPLTEVGALRLDGAPAEPSHRPGPGTTVDVAPVARPQHVPGWNGTFLLDVHLGSLARRLRLLGVDTGYDSDVDDDELVEQANAEKRLLLTQDRGLLKRRALWAGAFVRGSGAGQQLDDVLDRFAPPLRPWTRCPVCNGELATAPKSEVADRLEPGTRLSYDEFARCCCCGRVYWHGAHGRRLEGIVAAARDEVEGAALDEPAGRIRRPGQP